MKRFLLISAISLGVVAPAMSKDVASIHFSSTHSDATVFVACFSGGGQRTHKPGDDFRISFKKGHSCTIAGQIKALGTKCSLEYPFADGVVYDVTLTHGAGPTQSCTVSLIPRQDSLKPSDKK